MLLYANPAVGRREEGGIRISPLLLELGLLCVVWGREEVHEGFKS